MEMEAIEELKTQGEEPYPKTKVPNKMQAAASEREKTLEEEVQVAIPAMRKTFKRSRPQQNKLQLLQKTKKTVDPFTVYDVEDIFDFNQKLSSKAKFVAKSAGKFTKVFPEE